MQPALHIPTKEHICMHKVMLIGSVAGGRLAPPCPTSKCPPNPPVPPRASHLMLLGITAETDALNPSYGGLNNLGARSLLSHRADYDKNTRNMYKITAQ